MEEPYALLIVGGIYVLFAYLNIKLASPVLAIFNRWVRWIVFALAGAYLVHSMEWSDRPYPVLAITLFLSWFLVETLYNWVAITSVSKSEIPFFPKFSRNETGEEWPVQKRFFDLRDWLRNNGFKQTEKLHMELGMDVRIWSSIYEDEDRKIRIQILFVPSRTGNISVCYSLSSMTEGDIRVVTDNFFIPYGGFYPENWRMMRKPWARRLDKLLALHRQRLSRMNGDEVASWETDAIDDLNQQQIYLEKVNMEKGFLFPHHMREEHGRLTTEGCYRIWKEIWLLNYLGKPTAN